MKQPIFEGVATAMVTPFKNGTIDASQWEILLQRQIDAHVDAVVVCGTTGEAATMSDDEQLALIAHTVRYVAGRCKVIAGTGSNDTSHCVQLSRHAAQIGADALLVVTPYYNKCTQNGLAAHFTAVADAVDIPVIVYNVPSRTGMDISVDTYRVLSEHPRINGTKEAAGGVSKISRIRNACGDDLCVWSGNDDEAVPMMSVGAKGLISVLSNLRPNETVRMIHACLDGDFAAASRLQTELMPLIDVLFCEVNPIPIKKALNLVGFDVGELRLPLTPLSEANAERLKKCLS